jgi:hypothetical protein
MKLFAEVCLELRDLTARASIVDLEPDTIKNYTDLKEHYAKKGKLWIYFRLVSWRQKHYAKLIKPKKMIIERGANHFSQIQKKKISKNQKKVRCFICGRNNHTVEDAGTRSKSVSSVDSTDMKSEIARNSHRNLT